MAMRLIHRCVILRLADTPQDTYGLERHVADQGGMGPEDTARCRLSDEYGDADTQELGPNGLVAAEYTLVLGTRHELRAGDAVEDVRTASGKLVVDDGGPKGPRFEVVKVRRRNRIGGAWFDSALLRRVGVGA